MSLFVRSEKRALSYQQVWGSGGEWVSSSHGVTVDQALGVAAVFSCVDLIAGRISAMPLQAFRDVDGVKQKDTRQVPLLTAPSAVLAPDEWVYAGVASGLLWGNAYGFVARLGSDGWPTQVEWQHPSTVQAQIKDGRPDYQVNGVPVPPERMMHARFGLIRPGDINGSSPIGRLPVPIRTAVEAARYEMGWFTEGAHPSSVLATDQPVTKEQAQTIKDRFMEAIRGRREPVVLGAGVKYEAVQVGPVASGSAAIKQAIATEVANAFHVPPEMVGGSSGSTMTYTNLEAALLSLDVSALMPVYTRLERAISSQMPRPVYARFNHDSVTRTTLLDRYRAHDVALRDGWKSRNEVRRLEDMPSIPDGDEYLWPPYATSLTDPAAPTDPGGSGEGIPQSQG